MTICKILMFLCVFIFLSICVLPSSGVSETGKTQVVLLGTGSPVPDPDRSGPAIAVVVNGHAYLIDCGTGCVRQATKAFQKKG